MGPYLTVKEAADLAGVSPKRLRNLMSPGEGKLIEGIHFTRPRGLAPRFKREALVAWLEGLEGAGEGGRPLTRRHRRPRCKLDLSPVAGLNARPDGL